MMRFLYSIIDFGLGVVKNFKVETLSETPTDADAGRIWWDEAQERLMVGNGTSTPTPIGAAGEGNPSGASGCIQFTGGGGVFDSSTVFVFNKSNGRLGIGIGESNANVHIKATTDDGSTVALLIQDSNGDQILRIASDGKITTSVNSAFQFPRLSADPATATNGDVYYNTTTNKFRGYENGAWANLI